eukprot:g7256.t1
MLEDFTNAPRPNGQAPPIDAEDESTQSADEDAPEATGWLFARLLVCPFDLSAKKKRASEKVRRTNSEYF